jgi:hypothetical protein
MDSSEKAVRPYEGVTRRLNGVRAGDVAVSVRPAVRQAPVLPAGWAPLTADQQAAVLQACDRTPGALVFRVGASNPHVEFRVYRLDEGWAGLCVATLYEASADGFPAANRELIALASSDDQAVAIVVARVNTEIRAVGGTFGVALSTPAVLPEDPRRV